MCPACIGSTVLMLTGASSSGGAAAFIVRKALLKWRGKKPPSTRSLAAYPATADARDLPRNLSHG